jgi:hypothetical protein
MAIVKLDMTEYNALMENKKLLEDSLENEKKLNKKIKELQQEKIDLLKKNEKSVTIIKKEDSKQQILVKRPLSQIREKILRLATIMKSGNYGHDFAYMDYVHREISVFQDAFFTKSTLTDSPPVETIIYKGLDEFHNEEKTRLREEMEEKYKAQLKDLDNCREREQEAIRKMSEAVFAETKASDNLKKAEADIEMLTTENLELQEEVQHYEFLVDKIHEALNSGKNNFFSQGLKVRTAKLVMKKYGFKELSEWPTLSKERDE